MLEQLLYITCGLSAGLLGGYLGLGGGVIMVPFLTVVTGLDIKVAVPISMTAIVVNSFSASNEYLKKGMVDLELVIILSVFMVLGSVTGSFLSNYVSSALVSLILTVILLYAAISLLKGKKPAERITFKDNRTKYLYVCTVLAYATGTVGALVGIGGCVIIIPMLYLIIGLPLTTARGTCSLTLGFSAAAAATVYFLNGQIDTSILPGVVLGIIVGAKFGAYLGTMAKPLVVKILFFILMVYLAYRLSYEPLVELL